jgi:uncharacterized membrane protein YphA (DoxX/SURF4 family)
MLDDVDGSKHLVPEVDAAGHLQLNAKGKPVVKAESTLAAWQEFKDRVARRYRMTDDQKTKADKLYDQYKTFLTDYLDENAEKIVGYRDSLKRYQEELAQGGNGAPYYKKRVWDWEHEPEGPLGRQGYQKQAKGWLTDIDKMGTSFQAGLWDLLDEDQQQRGYFTASWNPFQWPRIEQINFAVTYGLTAIGLCLMLGLFTRLAALGGAAFMFFVLLTQPSLPWIYPPPGPESGHALLIDKNFIEMAALLLLATTAAGRWGGLDALLRRKARNPKSEIASKPE